MMNLATPLRYGLLLVALSAATARADEQAPSFEKDVRPILRAHCFQCHGEAKRPKGGLDVRLRRFLVEGGDGGAAVVPGHAAKSLLLERVRDGSMPKSDKKLSKQEIATLERWVAQGAKTLRPEPEKIGPGAGITEEERGFWAFQPIRRPTPPKVKDEQRVRTPIDAFLLKNLEEKGLSFAPDADRRTLIRRATFDLLGLPPTPDEVEAFVKDESPDAYEQLIDRLLASPHYGERWGRHWLDVAGYADSDGYNEADAVRDDAWRYRDYVIRAFNADMPFDRFIQEQLAGDEMVKPPYKNLTPAQADKLIATGFLRMAPDGTGTRNDDQALARNAVIGETVKVVSSALLGLTVGCAECHDHRFDPIPQRDYYRLRAVFEPALDWKNWREPARRKISLLSDAQIKDFFRLEAEAKKIEAGLQGKLKEFQAWVFAKELTQVPEAVRERAKVAGLAWQKDRNKLTKEQKKLLDDYPSLKVGANAGVLNLFLQKYGKGNELKQTLEENAKQAAAVRARRPQQAFIHALTEVPGQVPVTYLFERGNRETPGDKVLPGDLSVLTDIPLDLPLDDPKLPTTGRRLAYAKRLTDGTHPLTARVLVNRFWLHHFGRGLVATPGDFGTQGERPSHPELLDWLASEFMHNGWSLKKLHRQIMTSTAYHQASTRTEAGDRLDADNRLLGRYPVRRLEAEALRDAALAVVGRLNRQAFGPPVPISSDENSQVVVGTGKPMKDRAEDRRSVYVQVRRSLPVYLLKAFDVPQMEPNCELRNVSTVAPQSLVLMNNRWVVEQAAAFAERVRREAGKDARAQVVLAWRLAYAEEPSAADMQELVEYLREQPGPTALASLCQVLLASNRFLYVD